jgi:Leucine-rich repeat (LRR) protein
MVVRDNKLTTIPREIGNLKNLIFLNILGNRIIDIPDTIKYLDKSNGGKLHRVAVSIKDIGDENYNKLKRLLPNTIITNPQ